MSLRLIVDGAEQPQLGPLQIEPVPSFEQVMNPLALDKCAGKNLPKNRWARSRLEALDIDPAGQVKKLLFANSARAKRVGRFFRQNNKQRGKIVLLDGAARLHRQIVFPPAERRSGNGLR